MKHFIFRHAILLTTCFFATAYTSAQPLSGRVSGILCDTTGMELTQVAAVVVMNRSDSTTLRAEYISAGKFQFTYPAPALSEPVLYISAYGFQSKLLPLGSLDQDLGKIELRPLLIEMDSVLVTAVAPIKYGFVRGKDRFSIPEALGKKQIDLNMLLGKIPGLIYDGEKVSIAGSGAPTYLVNGFKPRPGELNAIRPEDVERVEVDRMPSARFEKSVRGVINIVLRNRKYDYLNGSVSEKFSYAQYAGNAFDVSLNNRMGRWINYVGYGYNYSHMKARMLYLTTLHGKEGNAERISDQTLWNKGNNHTLDLSPKFQIDDKSFVDAQYSFGRNSVQVPSRSTYRVVGTENSHITDKGIEDKDTHNLLLRYGNNFSDDHRLSLTFAYASIGNFSNNFTREAVESELDGTVQQIETRYKGNFASDVLTAVANYEFPIGKNLSGEIGGDFSRIWNDSYTHYAGGERIETSTHETQASLYFNFGQTIRKFFYEIGVRGEYLRKIGTDGKRLDEEPFSFMPAVRLSYQISDKTNISLYYRRSTTHPTVSERDPIMRYSNKYELTQGNPNLRSATENSLSLNVRLPQNIWLSAVYAHTDKEVIQTEDLYDEKKQITLLSWYNFPAYHSVRGNLFWFKKFGCYFPMFQASYRQIWADAPYLDGTVHYDQPKFSFTLLNSFDITDRISLSINGSYATSCDNLNAHIDSSWNLNASLTVRLLKNRNLLFHLLGANLLYNNYREESRYKQLFMRSTNYMYNRSVSVQVRFLFNNYRRSFSRNEAAAEAFERAE